MEKRILSAEELMPEYTELLKAGAELPLSVSGASMLPFLYPGRDAVFLKAPSGEFKRGDILLYRRTNGRYILHRLQKIRDDGLYFAGDAQDVIEGPVLPEQVVGTVTGVRRHGRYVGRKSPSWLFYKYVWRLSLGCRGRMFTLFRRIKNTFGRKK